MLSASVNERAKSLSLDRSVWVVDSVNHVFYSEVEAMVEFHQIVSFGMAADNLRVTKYYQQTETIIARNEKR